MSKCNICATCSIAQTKRLAGWLCCINRLTRPRQDPGGSDWGLFERGDFPLRSLSSVFAGTSTCLGLIIQRFGEELNGGNEESWRYVHLAGSSTTVHRLGYGAMQLAGPNMFGPPKDMEAAFEVLRVAVQAGVNHIDTSDVYGPHITNQIIRNALYPYSPNLTIATKVGSRRGEDGSWIVVRRVSGPPCRIISAT